MNNTDNILKHEKTLIKGAASMSNINNDSSAFIKKAQDFWNSFFYENYCIMQSAQKYLNGLEVKQEDEIIREMISATKISAKTDRGMLFLRVPHPPNLRSKFYWYGFKDDAETVRNSLSPILCDIEFYPKKTLWVANIYSEKESFCVRPINFDNYHLKVYIDELCDCYPGTDNPLYTDTYMFTRLSDKILPMTYLVITPKSSFSEDDIFNMLCRSFKNTEKEDS